MAKLSAHGDELMRYFSIKNYCLVSVRSDGTTLRQAGFDRTWRRWRVKKAKISLDAWLAGKKAIVAQLPPWAQAIKRLPSEAEMREWLADGVCETPTGDRVEPDGEGWDGAPSWLRLLGMV